MTSAVERTAIVVALEKILSNDGWIPDNSAQLPQEFGWTPDRILARADGKKLAIEVEEEVNIPRFLVRKIQSHRQLLNNIRIIIAAVRNTPLDMDTAKVGIENGISVYADFAEPILILDSSFPDEITPASEDIKTAHERFIANKRIPRIMTQELEGLSHLVYARDLIQFAHDYESCTFSNREAEHQFVSDFIISRFGNRFRTSSLFEGLNSMGLLEEVAEVLLGKRPHFLHSVQTFLLGAIIIDKNYDLFQDLYSSGYEADDSIEIDIPWFFASLFHDIAFLWENVERLSPVGEHREPRSRGLSSVYSPHLLGCLFEQMKVGPVDPEWEPEATSAPGELCELLSRHRLNDHGVMGALQLISPGTQINRRILATGIYPAALAISLHNSPLWPELLEARLFPVSAKRFPLIFLLSLCDNITEWGREKRIGTTMVGGPNALVSSLSFSPFIVNIDLWVDEPARGMIVKNRFGWITKRLFDMEDLQVKCTFSSTHVGEST